MDEASVTTIYWRDRFIVFFGLKRFDFVFCSFLFLKRCSFFSSAILSFLFLFVLGLAFFPFLQLFFFFISSSIAWHSALVNTLAEPVIVEELMS